MSLERDRDANVHDALYAIRRRWIALLAITGSLTASLIGTPASASGEKTFGAEDATAVRTFAHWTHAVFSPDDIWLAYTVQDNAERDTTDARRKWRTSTGGSPTAQNCDIWLTNIKTGESRNLTEGQGTNWDPVWSPDGRYLAFYSDRDGGSRIWLWEMEGNYFHRLTDAVVRSSGTNLNAVRWTPDSARIVANVLPLGVTLEQANNIETAAAPPVSDNRGTGSTVTVYRSVRTDSRGDVTGRSLVGTSSVSQRYLADLVFIDVPSGRIAHRIQGLHPANYVLAPDGKRLAILDARGFDSTNDRSVFDLEVYSISTRSLTKLDAGIEQGFTGSAISWSPHSHSLAYVSDGRITDQSDLGSTRGDCFVVSMEGGSPRNVTSRDHPPFNDELSIPLWSPTGDAIYLTVMSSDLDVALASTEIGTVWKASVKQRSATQIARVPSHSVWGVVAKSDRAEIWSPGDGRSIVVGTQDEMTRQAGFWRVELPSGRLKKLYEDRIAWGYPTDFALSTEVSHDGQTVAYLSESAQHPQDIWVAGSQFDNRRRVSDINPQLNGVSFGEGRSIEFRNLDGLALHGALRLPPGWQEGRRYPMIVWLYSGSFMSRGVFQFGLESSTLASLNAQVLASHGYAVLVVDVPLNIGTPILDLTKAVLPAVDQVVNLGIADLARVGVFGHSYGAYSAVSLIVQTEIFKAAVAYAGAYDLVSWGGGPAVRRQQGDLGGTLWQFRDRYVENSPIFYLDRVRTPLLLVHGELDSTPTNQAIEVYDGLRRLGQAVVFAKYANEGHVLKSRANIVDYWARVLAWFDEHLKVSGTSDH